MWPWSMGWTTKAAPSRCSLAARTRRKACARLLRSARRISKEDRATVTSSMFITHEGAVATLHLNRTERLNAFGMRQTVELNEMADTLAAEDVTRVVVITGEGRSFSTGIDLKELAAGDIDMTYHHRWEA